MVSDGDSIFCGMVDPPIRPGVLLGTLTITNSRISYVLVESESMEWWCVVINTTHHKYTMKVWNENNRLMY